ncbi:MAG: monovalent cation/H+ antiporter subunit D family protein [Parvibaculum sp.]|uniref:monovalent cation/H+ antiporter subunit D family protein n=1 Tax=Parvibaculum sp. TaxID=2024848 RepID=UPI0025CFD7A4|nr:monovalent cation/H+ antiporter subunit D family protein [Parvibaculum sp.]MCE9649391.1 monovalent cation/H+ antiporter subunit D family protein [Parvibaculum sp.]
MPDALASQLPVLQIVVPLILAPFCALLGGNRAWAIAFAASLAAFAVAVALFVSVLDGGVISYHLGGWAPPIGIEYRVDVLNAFVLLIVSGVGALTLLYARASVAHEIEARRQGLFYTALVLCLTGLLGVTITGDAFNVFVFLEISSLSTYALVASGVGRDKRALTASYNYLIMGTIGATFFVIGLGLLYMITGTLNMVDLAQRLLEQGDSRTLRMGFAFVIVGIGLKLAIFPLHLWLPNAYSYAPSAVSAFISATSTKVAVYVLLRFLFTIFGFSIGFEVDVLRYVVLPLAIIGIFAGSIVAIFQDDLKRLLAYSSIAQIGYMLVGLTLLSHAGLMASIIHLFNHAVAKAALFMVAGAYVMQAGTSSIRDLRGIGRDMPWTTAAFVAGGLSLVGVPLTVGFISKWYLVQAALAQGWWPVAMLIVASSLLAFAYVWRVVEAAYLREAPEGVTRKEAPLSMLIPMWALAGMSLFFGIDSDLTSSAASRAANALISASSLFWQ